MRAPRLLRVADEPPAFAALFAAVRSSGLRVGWLELGEPPNSPGPLAAAAGLGALRAVAAGNGGVVVVKPLQGPPVLADLLREHFLGCALVLVRGAVDAPVLRPAPEGSFRLSAPGLEATLTASELTARLLRPRPWG